MDLRLDGEAMQAPTSMLMERLKMQADIAKGAIDVEMNEDGETDVFEHSNEGLVEVLEQARAAILSISQERDRLREQSERRRQRYNLAARRVSEVEAESRALREALEPFVKHHAPWMSDWGDDIECTTHSRHTFGDLRRARAALQKEPS